MSEIVIIRDEIHPLLDKIKERILQLNHTVTVLYWKDMIGYDFKNVKVIYMDRMGEEYPTYETQIFCLNELAKKYDIKIINDPYKYIITRNKILTALYLKDKGINIPQTAIITKLEQIDLLDYEKLICKPYLGACADGIIPFYADNIPSEVKKMLEADGMIVIQEFVYNPNKFIWRIDIVNGQVIQLNQRYPFNKSSEFPICNGTHGGEIKVWNPKDIPENLERLVRQVHDIIGLNVMGIDVLVNEFGELYLLEVNPEPDITLDFIEFPYKIAEYLVQECEGENR